MKKMNKKNLVKRFIIAIIIAPIVMFAVRYDQKAYLKKEGWEYDPEDKKYHKSCRNFYEQQTMETKLAAIDFKWRVIGLVTELGLFKAFGCWATWEK